MILPSARYLRGAIDLLDDDETDELMRKHHIGKRDRRIDARSHLVTDAKGTTDDKDEPLVATERDFF